MYNDKFMMFVRYMMYMNVSFIFIVGFSRFEMFVFPAFLDWH